MDCSIDISIIQDLLNNHTEYSECLANVTSQQLNEAFSENFIGKKAFVKSNYDGGDCFYMIDCDSKMGVDIPVRISRGEEANGKIMFIGESVLRNPKDDFKNDCLLVGTPFAIVGKDNQPESCDVYKMIFRNWLEMNYQIYITDYIKMWKQGYNYLKGKDHKDFREKSQELLDKEIDKYDPDYIVPFGNEAANVIERINKARKNLIKGKIINLTHPSNNAKIHWRIQMYEEIIRYLLEGNIDIKKINEMEGMKVLDDKVSDDNVARFANKIIENIINKK